MRLDNESKTVYMLEMRSPDDLCPTYANLPNLRIERMHTRLPEFNKFLYIVIGCDYRWRGRLSWGKAEWTSYVCQDNLHTWVAYVGGVPAGYCELEKDPQGDVEIRSFGLLPTFIGQRLGGHLLTVVTEYAWSSMGATRVWLYTNTHDHPHALPNYLARGFRICDIKTEPAKKTIPSFWD